MDCIKHVKKIIGETQHISFGCWPTPFMRMEGLKRSLELEGVDCPNLWIKREDLTPLGAGGNKIRKLEYVLAKATELGADVLLNTGEVQSNQVVQTAACAAHLGIPCELFLGRTDPPLSDDDQETGNILLCRILGAKIHLVPPGADRGLAMRQRAEMLKKEGKNPYIIPRGSSTAEGSLGSLACFFELVDQAKANGFVPDAIAVTVGSSGTAAGFLVGSHVLAISDGPDIPILAFDTFGTDYHVQAHERIMEHAEESWSFLSLPGKCGERLLRLSCDFVGPGYSRPYQGMIDAVHQVARHEGVILDPNYTGKCMAGLLYTLRRETFRRNQNVVYLHTGGLPALFAMRRHFA